MAYFGNNNVTDMMWGARNVLALKFRETTLWERESSQVIYGFQIDKNESSPYEAVIYTDANADYEPVYMNRTSDEFEWGDWQPFVEELCRPCILNDDGTVEFYLDRSNQTLKESGEEVGVISDTQHYMVEFKRMYIYASDTEDYNTIKMSFSKIDDTYKAYNWCNETGEPQPYMYMPMFNGSLVSDKLKSVPSVSPMVSKNATTEKAYAEANGDGWHLETAHSRFIKMYLCYLLGHSLNTQLIFGEGCVSGSSATTTGQLIEKGAFYGGASSVPVKTFYCENWWGNVWTRCEGMIINSYEQLIKNYPPFNFTGDGYTSNGTQPSASNSLKSISTGEDGIRIDTVGGSSTAYFCDYYYQASSTLRVPIFGGIYALGSRAGVACWDCVSAASVSSATLGASPYFIPLS